MKPIERRTGAVRGRGPLTRALGLATLFVYALLATVAQASTVLVADTTLVSGSAAAVYSFQAAGPGTVSVQLTNLDWPQALSSVSFMASTGDRVLSAWTDTSSGTQLASFQVAGSGMYFANVMAAAGGPLDLGVYSLSLSFTPATPVPLPPSGELLLAGVAGIIGLILWRRRAFTPSAIPLAPQRAP